MGIDITPVSKHARQNKQNNKRCRNESPIPFKKMSELFEYSF